MLGRRALATLALGFAALPPPALGQGSASARLAAAGRAARLSLGLPAGTAWQMTAAADPPRLVIELGESVFPAATRLPAAGPVRGARVEGGRLVIALAGPVAVRRLPDAGGQAVLEIAPGPAAAFARAAGTSQALARGGGARLPLVVLDPGHGGRDPGAVGARGTQEKQVVLACAQELRRLLEAGGRCRVAMTRTADRFVPLADRVDFARSRNAALFLSLHADSAPGARGASVYTLGEGTDTFSMNLARRENEADRAGGLRLPSLPPEVQAILLSLMQAETRAGSARLAAVAVTELGREVALLPNTHREAGFLVLKSPEIPSALVELGFLSHPQDEAALRQPAHRAKLARALSRAVQGWLARGETMAAG